jgi:hypothetical protein
MSTPAPVVIEPDELNSRIMEIDTELNDVALLDMRTYHLLLNIYNSTYISSKAEEIFCGTALTRPIQITIGKSSPIKLPMLEHWRDQHLVPLIKELHSYEYGPGLVGLKNVEVRDSELPVPRIAPMDQGRIFVIRNKKTFVTEYKFQWYTHDKLLPTTTRRNNKMKPSKRQKPMYGLAGFKQKKIPYDPDIYFYVGHKPSMGVDNVMEFVRYHNLLISGGNSSQVPSFSMVQCRTCYTSPIARMLPEYFKFMRLSETVIRIEENKVNPPYFVETKIPGNGELLEKFQDVRDRTSAPEHYKERYRLMSSTVRNNIPRSQLSSAFPENGPSGIFERENGIGREVPTPIYTSDAISGYGRTGTHKLMNAIRVLRHESEGIYEDAPNVGGRRRIVGGPLDTFKFEGDRTGRSDYIQWIQEYLNVICEIFSLPSSIIHMTKNAKQEMNTTERDLIERRIKEITDRMGRFTVDYILVPLIRNGKEVIDKWARDGMTRKKKQEKIDAKQQAEAEEKAKESDIDPMPGVSYFHLDGTELTGEELAQVENDLFEFQSHLEDSLGNVKVEFDLEVDTPMDELEKTLSNTFIPNELKAIALVNMAEKLGRSGRSANKAYKFDEAFFLKKLEEADAKREKEQKEQLAAQQQAKQPPAAKEQQPGASKESSGEATKKAPAKRKKVDEGEDEGDDEVPKKKKPKKSTKKKPLAKKDAEKKDGDGKEEKKKTDDKEEKKGGGGDDDDKEKKKSKEEDKEKPKKKEDKSDEESSDEEKGPGKKRKAKDKGEPRKKNKSK